MPTTDSFTEYDWLENCLLRFRIRLPLLEFRVRENIEKEETAKLLSDENQESLYKGEGNWTFAKETWHRGFNHKEVMSDSLSSLIRCFVT